RPAPWPNNRRRSRLVTPTTYATLITNATPEISTSRTRNVRPSRWPTNAGAFWRSANVTHSSGASMRSHERGGAVVANMASSTSSTRSLPPPPTPGSSCRLPPRWVALVMTGTFCPGRQVVNHHPANHPAKRDHLGCPCAFATFHGAFGHTVSAVQLAGSAACACSPHDEEFRWQR